MQCACVGKSTVAQLGLAKGRVFPAKQSGHKSQTNLPQYLGGWAQPLRQSPNQPAHYILLPLVKAKTEEKESRSLNH